jgi:hypothetical protein
MADWVSCKLSFTLISFAEQQGLDPAELFFDYPIPENWLTDPGQWITPAELDQFILQFLGWYQSKSGKSISQPLEFLREVGRSSSELRSWGILDSVLRLMPDVFEVLERPQVFLGHFLSPAPEVQLLLKSPEEIRWRGSSCLPQYPRIQSLLWGSLEALPTFMGLQAWQLNGWSPDGVWVFPRCGARDSLAMAEAPLSGLTPAGRLDIPGAEPSDKASELSSSAAPSARGKSSVSTTERDFGPRALVDAVMKEVVQSNEEALMTSLSLSRELFREMVAVIEQPKKPRKRKNQGMEVATLSPPELNWALAPISEESIPEFQRNEVPQRLQQNLNRMLDFFVRASQLVTLLAKQNPGQAQVWMKRLGWTQVQQRFPDLVEESMAWVREWAKSEPLHQKQHQEQDKPAERAFNNGS